MRSNVYWLRLKEHTDPLTQGYVGVSRIPAKRFARHKYLVETEQHVNMHLSAAFKKYGSEIELEILFEGEEPECYAKELELRPQYQIGWNQVPGGHGGSTALGQKRSEEFRKKRSDYMMGRQIAKGNHKPKTAEHRANISKGLMGRVPSEEQRRKQSAAMKGRKLTEEHKEKIRQARLRREASK